MPGSTADAVALPCNALPLRTIGASSTAISDALVYTHHQLHYLVEEYGADHILMGTDYPADMGEIDPIGFIEGADKLDDRSRRAILGENAARLLGLEVPKARR